MRGRPYTFLRAQASFFAIWGWGVFFRAWGVGGALVGRVRWGDFLLVGFWGVLRLRRM